MKNFEMTASQKAFFDRHGINLSQVFDAYGLRKSEYSRIMRSSGYYFAIRTSPCSAFGHTIRTRSGHCIQCKPENIAYFMRHHTPGQVYIAISKSGNMLKVGTAKDAFKRLDNINRDSYGGRSDWELKIITEIENSGNFEHLLHSRLRNYKLGGSFFTGNDWVSHYELFNCSLTVAKKNFLELIPSDKKYYEFSRNRFTEKFSK